MTDQVDPKAVDPDQLSCEISSGYYEIVASE